MTFESISPILLIFVRYAISGFGVWLGTKGFTEADVSTLTEQLAFMITGGIIAALPAIWAALKRPSVKAMETAKAVDRQIPKGEDVVLKTPAGEPDIVIASTGKKK